MNGKIDQRVRRSRLTLQQLEVFTATARAGSTRTAAEQVSRSQSATSMALAALEEALAVELFDRVGRRLVLNDSGQTLLPRAVDLLERAAELQGLFQAGVRAPLRIAASYTIGEYLLPELIASWEGGQPDCAVELRIANTRDVLEAVVGLDVDLGFVEGSATHPALCLRRWHEDALVIFAAPGHPLASSPADPVALGRGAWILRERGSGTREASDRWLMSVLPEVHARMELGSNEAVKRAVRAGCGLGCLSWLSVREWIGQGLLVEVRAGLSPFRRTLATACHRTRPLGATARSFLAHALERVHSPALKAG